MRVKYTEEGLLLIPETEKEGGGLSAFCRILKNVGELLEMSGNITVEWPEYIPFKIKDDRECSANTYPSSLS